MTTKAGLDIYKENDGNKFVIINYAIRPLYGGMVGWGDLIRVTMEEISERGVGVILDNLEGFEGRDGGQGSEFGKLTSREKNKFFLEHTLVGVRQESSTKLILTPMHPVGHGGFVGEPDEEMTIELPCSSRDFAEVLISAFAKAG